MSVDEVRIHFPLMSVDEVRIHFPLMSVDEVRIHFPLQSVDEVRIHFPLMSVDEVRIHIPLMCREHGKEGEGRFSGFLRVQRETFPVYKLVQFSQFRFKEAIILLNFVNIFLLLQFHNSLNELLLFFLSIN